MFSGGGGGLGITGAVQTQPIAAWAEIRSKRHSSTVLTSPSLRATGAFHRHVSLPQQRALRQSPPLQTHLIPANARLSVIGKETRPWMTGAGDHVAAVTAQATCVLVRKLRVLVGHYFYSGLYGTFIVLLPFD